MGKFYPKPYKKLCRETGKWVTVTPEPIEFIDTIKHNSRLEFLEAELLEKFKLTNKDPLKP